MLMSGLMVCLVGALVVLLFIRTRTSGPTTVVIGTPAQPGQSQEPVGPHTDPDTGILVMGIGDTVVSNGVLVGVTNVTQPAAGGAAESGSALLQVDVEVHNAESAGGETFSVSGTNSFDLQDGGGRSYAALAPSGGAKPPDGTLAPGATLDGSLLYEIQSGQTYRLLFKNDRVSNGEIVIDLGKW